MQFKINEKTYNLSVFWSTTTLRQAIQISEIDFDEKKLENLLTDDGSNVFDQETYNYIRKCVAILSDCPLDVLNNVYDAQMGALWDIISFIIRSLYYVKFEKYASVGLHSINFKGKKYYLPESLKINYEEILAFQEPSINVVEVSNIVYNLNQMKNKGVFQMKYICAILLREDPHETYDVKKINARAEIFEELPMSVVFECFFFINSFSSNYLTSSLNFLPPTPKEKVLKKITRIAYGFFQWLRRNTTKTLTKLKKYLFGNYVRS